MGVMITIAIGIASVLGAVLSQLLTEELKAWTPWFVDHLIRCAVQRLPHAHRERFTEEWKRHIEDTPGCLAKLAVASHLVVGAIRIARAENASAPRKMTLPDLLKIIVEADEYDADTAVALVDGLRRQLATLLRHDLGYEKSGIEVEVTGCVIDRQGQQIEIDLSDHLSDRRCDV